MTPTGPTDAVPSAAPSVGSSLAPSMAPPLAPSMAPPLVPPARRPPPLLPVPPAIARYWRADTQGAPTSALGGCLGVGLLAGPLVVGTAPGLGLALVLATVWVVAVPTLVRAGRRADLLLAAVSVACAAVVAWRDATWLVA